MKKVMSCLLVLAVLFSTVLAASLLAEEQVITGAEENSRDVNSTEKNSVDPLLQDTEIQNTQESQMIQPTQEDTKIQEEPGVAGIMVNGVVEGAIDFPDKNLLAAMLGNYGVDKNNDGCITQEELKTLTILFLSNKNITNLAGLEYATNVTSFYLNDNTGLKNVDVLKGLTNLSYLNLNNTSVSDGDKLSFIQLKNTTFCIGGISYQALKPTGLSDKYTASSSDESIVVASVENNTSIRLEAKKTGTATISLYIGTDKKDFQVTVNAQPEGAIVFKDTNLFAGLISCGIDKNADGCITMEEIQAATYVSLSNRNIKDITELGYAKELTMVYLNNNAELSNIDSLKKLEKLSTVNLNGTAVSDSDKVSLLKLPDFTGFKGYGQTSTILPGGLAETYTITSSNSDIVEASFTNSYQSAIQLFYKAEGTATITMFIGQGTGKTFQVTVGAVPENAIEFEDSKLGVLLMKNGVDMNKDNYITADELAKLKILNLASCGITSLKGLEEATTLINLDLDNNPELSNIEPLRGIAGNLDDLRLSGTQVSTADRMSLLSLNDVTLNQGASFNWQKPSNILDSKTVSFSNSEIAMIDTYNTVITGKNPGTTVVTIESDGVKRSFTVTVNPITAEQPVGEKVTNLPVLYASDQTALDANGDLWDVGNGETKLIKSGVKEYSNLGDKVKYQPNEPDYINKWGAILDTAGTLWLRDLTSADKQPVEKVKNVKKTISEVVYTSNDFYCYDSLSFALDNSNSLWMMKVDSQQQPYTKVLDNVLFQDWIFAVDTNHTLWQLCEDKKELLTDVEDFDYFSNHNYADLYVLKIDHTLWHGNNYKGDFKKIASDVDYLIKNETGNKGYVKMDGTYWKYYADGSSTEVSGINNVQKGMGPFIVKNDSSTWYGNSNLNFAKAINTEIKEYKSGYSAGYDYCVVDVDNTIWKFDKDSGTEAVRIGDDFQSFTSTSEYNSSYETITGFVDGEGIWYDMNGNVQAEENDVMGRSNYFLKGDQVVYFNQIPLLNQVVSISDEGNGQIYATRTDGSIWTLSPNATPAKIEVAKIMQGDVDGSGKVQAFDALMSLQIATGKKQGTPTEVKAADVGNSGKVEAFDALQILQYATGKITAF